MEIVKSEIKSSLAISNTAREQADKLIAQGQAIVAVGNPEEQTIAVIAAKSIKTWLAEVEKSRKAVKEPVLALGKRIDEIARDYAEPLEAEMNRIGELVGEFQQKEAERVREAERKRQEEIARVERERQAAAELEREANERLADESATLSDAEQAALASQMVAQATEKKDDIVRAPLPEASRTTGMVSRFDVVKFEVTDAAALYKLRPHWFRLEPKRSVIMDEITKDTVIEGLKVWTENKVGFRA